MADIEDDMFSKTSPNQWRTRICKGWQPEWIDVTYVTLFHRVTIQSRESPTTTSRCCLLFHSPHLFPGIFVDIISVMSSEYLYLQYDNTAFPQTRSRLHALYDIAMLSTWCMHSHRNHSVYHTEYIFHDDMHYPGYPENRIVQTIQQFVKRGLVYVNLLCYACIMYPRHFSEMSLVEL